MKVSTSLQFPFLRWKRTPHLRTLAYCCWVFFCLSSQIPVIKAQTAPGRRVVVSEPCVRIQAQHSGSFIALKGNGWGDGKPLHQYEERNLNHFEWVIDPVGNREHRIVSKRSGKVLTIDGKGDQEGQWVVQWEWLGNRNQRWYLEEINQGIYFISNKEGLYLEISGADKGNGAGVRVGAFTGEDNQIFRLKPEACSTCENLAPISFASYSGSEGWVPTDFVHVRSGDFVSLSGWASERGIAFPPAEWEWRGPNGFYSRTRTALIARDIQEEQAGLYTATVSFGGCVRQLPIKLRVEGLADTVEKRSLMAQELLCTGIQSVKSLLYVAPLQAEGVWGENVGQWVQGGNPLLDWRIEYIGNREHRIIHKASSQVLTLGDPLGSMDRNVRVAEWGERADQVWFIEYQGDDAGSPDNRGAIFLRNKESNLYLEIAEGSGNIYASPFHGESTQEFLFRPDQCHSSTCDSEVSEVVFNSLSGGRDIEIIDEKIFFESELPDQFNIEAIPTPGVESVGFTLMGPVEMMHTASRSPYRLPGDRVALSLPVGSYSLTVSVYAEDGGAGEVCSIQTYSFQIASDPSIAELSAGVLIPEQQSPLFTCKVGQSVRLSATSSGLRVPKGFEVLHLLSVGDSLIISQENERRPEFFVFEPDTKRYRIHTLVYDANGFDPTIIQFDTTSISDVVNEVQGSGTLIDLDQKGASFEFLACGNICGQVFEDANGNGLLDVGEKKLSGQLISLLDANEAKLRSIYSDSQGAYCFENLTGGAYYVKFSPPSQYSFTLQDQGDEAQDSDVQPSTGLSQLISLQNGEKESFIDAGVVPKENCPVDGGMLKLRGSNSYKVCELGASFAIGAEATDQLLPNENFFVFYLLSSGEDLVIEQIDDVPKFTISPRVATFRVHTLVASLNPLDSNFFDLGKILLHVTTVADIMDRIQESDICVAFDPFGTVLEIEPCQAQGQGRFVGVGSEISEEEEQGNTELSIRIFPNPVYYLLSLSLQRSQQSPFPPIMEVTMFDMQGREMLSQVVRGEYFTVDVSNYPPGVYLINLRMDGKQISEKFLKK